MSTHTSSKPNGRPLKRTKRACAARAKALATGKGRVPRDVAAKRLATKCPPPGRRRKPNGADLLVANTILAQLGGAGRMTAMLGANTFSGSENALTFRIKTPNKHKIKLIKVALEPSDTYRVELWSVKGHVPTLVKALDHIYGDGLVRAIEEETGLYLSLSGRKANGAAGSPPRLESAGRVGDYDVLVQPEPKGKGFRLVLSDGTGGTRKIRSGYASYGEAFSHAREYIKNGGEFPAKSLRKPNAGFGWSTTQVSGKKVIVAENGKPLLSYAVVDGRGAKLESIYATSDAHARKQLTSRTPKARIVSKKHVLATSPHGRALLREGMRKTNGAPQWIVVADAKMGTLYVTVGGTLSKIKHMAKTFTTEASAQKNADQVTKYGIPARVEPVQSAEASGSEVALIPHVPFDAMSGDTASIVSRVKRTDGPFSFYEYRVAIKNSRNPLQTRTVTIVGDEHGRVRLPESNGDLIALMMHLAKNYGRKANGANMVEVKVLSRTKRRRTVRGVTFNSYDLVMQVPGANGRATTLRLEADAHGVPNLPDDITDGTLREMILMAARNYGR